jgi:drug/metabolite transporter, DME family
MFVGYLLFGRALAHVPASTATTLSLLEPAVATVLAVLVVGERLPVAGWAGLVLIAACLVTLTVPARAARPPGTSRPGWLRVAVVLRDPVLVGLHRGGQGGKE